MNSEDSVIIAQSEKDPRNREQAYQFKKNLYQLLKSKTGLVGLVMICLGLLINFLMVYSNQLPPSWFYTFPDIEQKNYYFGKYLVKTWTHLTAFFIGLFAGHLCRSTLQLSNVRQLKEESSSPRTHSNGQQQQSNFAPKGNGRSGGALVRGSIQLAAFVCMMAIIFSTYSWSTQEAPSPLVAAFYDALSRLVWSMALVTIMVQLCLPDIRTNRYSQFARLLSHPICIVLGRLSFLAYLISPYVHTFILAVEEQSLFPSLFLIFHVIVGNIVITYAIAFILAIVIEQPIRQLVSRFVICRTYSSGRFCTLETQRTSARLKSAANQHHARAVPTTCETPTIIATRH